VGFVRKATIISTGGLARAGGLKGNSKKDRDAKANEKMVKIEDKRFKAEQKVAKQQHRAAKAAAQAATTVVPAATLAHPSTLTPKAAQGAPAHAPQGPPPGWYLDPDDGSLQRWWDGTGWTEVKRGNEPGLAPPFSTP